ncbi:MAG: pyrroline-5-carboxylate reductase [Clostridia bacterium]|nr:pyrroline-5-carboxylate reductase [Clostridia bacterium]
MKVGFLGCGNMGGALARAVRRADATVAIALSDTDTAKAEALAAALTAEVTSAEALLWECDVVFLGLKPQVLGAALAALPTAAAASRGVTFVSMAAGVTLASLSAMLAGAPVIRIMPNTAVLVGEGMTVYATTPNVTAKAEATFLSLMAASGKCDALPEELIDAACAVSGCGPAFAYLILDAMAEGGVQAGLSRERALAYAAQTVRGAMRMAVETGKTPAELKVAVCSPGGSTIEGVKVLEGRGLPTLVREAVAASFARTKELGK